ncbi:uncharacterized membrane protein At1g16860-like [Typha latifolia]|uniref:uncharacterized membrane protein At1g16860-like n=1 Tax=Typha latifolia TaxID=4733 RepID=UPI003C2D7159
MGSRFPSHQLSNGLYVSGRPEQPKERSPTMSSSTMPYTGGDIKKSGELGKMFDLHVEKSRKSGPLANAPSRTGSIKGAASNSGPLMQNAASRSNYSTSLSSGAPGSGGSNRQKSNSGPLNKHGDSGKKLSGPQSGGMTPMARQNSGPLQPVLPTTGLITSGPLNSSGTPRRLSGALDSTGSMKHHSTSFVHNQAVTYLSKADGYSFKGSLPKQIFCWNACWGISGVVGFINQYPDAELRTAKDGQYVKITGVVTCGHVPLESSFQKVPRCVYTSTCLYEYRGWNSKPANSKHRRFTWGLRSMERRAVDFYISDFQSGLRALVKTGYGARVTTYVDESFVVDINPDNKDMSPEFLRWLRERNLSSDDRLMRLKEGYIKEGSTVSVMGVVRKNNNVLMIVPPSEPSSTGCQWTKCMLPAKLEGIVLRCEDTSQIDVIPV